MRCTGICLDCNEPPKENASGVMRCACGHRWHGMWKVEGTEEEAANLKRYGFHLTLDCQGNKYYCGPMGHIIEYYADGTWNSDLADPSLSLQEYLDRIEQLSSLLAQI